MSQTVDEYYCKDCDLLFWVDSTKLELDQVMPYCPNCSMDEDTEKRGSGEI